MEQDKVNNAKPPYPQGCTPLQGSLYFRVRNKSQPPCKELIEPQYPYSQVDDKVKYLHNEYLSILFYQQIVGLDFKKRRDATEAKKRAMDIQTIIISIEEINGINVALIITLFNDLHNWNPKINFIIITNPFGQDRELLLKIFSKRKNNILVIQQSQQIRLLEPKLKYDNNLRVIFARKKQQNQMYGQIHGKLWLIKYKNPKKLRVCISSANLSTIDWTVGGNAFWKKDFDIKPNNPSNNNLNFQETLIEFLQKALTTQYYQQISRLLNIRVQDYLFNNIDNVHLIITSFKEQITYRNRKLSKYGLHKIRDIIKRLLQRYRGEYGDDFEKKSQKYKNISIISPFISTANYQGHKKRYRRYFENLMGCTYQAFHGKQFYGYDYWQERLPLRPNRRRRQILSDYQRQFRRNVLRPQMPKQKYKHLRIFQLTNQEAYKAIKYELQTKFKRATKLPTEKQFDLLHHMQKLRKNNTQRKDAIDIVQQLSDFAQFYALQSQFIDNNRMRFSNFTLNHTKLIACTHYDDKNNQKIPKLPDILYVGSNNFTPNSWGFFQRKSVKYCNLQLGVLIQVHLPQIITQHTSIKFITSNQDYQLDTKEIKKISNIFSLDNSSSKTPQQRKLETFKQRLQQQQRCLQYRKKFKKWFKSKTIYNRYQIQINYTIGKKKSANTNVKFLESKTYADVILYGQKELLQAQEKAGGNIKDIIWIADMALLDTHQNQNGLLIIWYFEGQNIFTKPTPKIQEFIIKQWNPSLRFLPLNESHLREMENQRWQQEFCNQIREAKLC